MERSKNDALFIYVIFIVIYACIVRASCRWIDECCYSECKGDCLMDEQEGRRKRKIICIRLKRYLLLFSSTSSLAVIPLKIITRII
jgi:hypothetical protein